MRTSDKIKKKSSIDKDSDSVDSLHDQMVFWLYEKLKYQTNRDIVFEKISELRTKGTFKNSFESFELLKLNRFYLSLEIESVIDRSCIADICLKYIVRKDCIIHLIIEVKNEYKALEAMRQINLYKSRCNYSFGIICAPRNDKDKRIFEEQGILFIDYPDFFKRNEIDFF